MQMGIDLESLTIYRAESDPGKKKVVMDNRLHDLKMRGQAAGCQKALNG